VSKKSLKKVGIFNEEYDGNYGYEDIELAFRLWHKGYIFFPIPNSVGFHLGKYGHKNAEINQKKFEKYKNKILFFYHLKKRILIFYKKLRN